MRKIKVTSDELPPFLSSGSNAVGCSMDFDCIFLFSPIWLKCDCTLGLKETLVIEEADSIVNHSIYSVSSPRAAFLASLILFTWAIYESLLLLKDRARPVFIENERKFDRLQQEI